MSWWCDILRQCVFLSFFIIPIPIGAYTIHNGSSAVVALVTYTVLSLLMPVAYVGSAEATFGPSDGRVSRKAFIGMWFLVGAAMAIASMHFGGVWKELSFWQWPTIGRDIVFILVMYVELVVTMWLAYLVSTWHKKPEGAAK